MGVIRFEDEHLVDYIWVGVALVIVPVLIVFYRLLATWLQGCNPPADQDDSDYEGLGVKPKVSRDGAYAGFLKINSRMSERVALWLTTSIFGSLWLLFQVFLSILSSGLYVVQTYHAGTSPFFVSEVIISIFLTIDYLLFFYIAPDSLRYFISPFSLIDFVTILPVYVTVLRGSLSTVSLAFVRPLRILRSARIMRTYRMFSFASNDIQRQLLVVIMSGVSVIFCGASLVQLIEASSPDGQVLQFHDALYFIVSTFTTVGYGDITVKTPLGRIVMIVLILGGFFVVSYQTAILIGLLNQRSAYSGKFRRDGRRPHIVLCGHVTYVGVFYFFKELYHRTRDSRQLRVVFLSPKEPSMELKALIESPYYSERVRFLVGSALNDVDLKRANVSHAAAVFIMNDKFRAFEKNSDSELILRALAVREYSSDVPVFIQLNQRRNSQYLRASGIDGIMSMDEMKSLILGQNCMAPGFSTLISNLVLTFSPDQTDLVKSPWQEEYYKGCTNQIYTVELPNSLNRATFAAVALELFKNTRTIFFGIQIFDEEEDITLINPGKDFVLSGGELAFFITTYESSRTLSWHLDKIGRIMAETASGKSSKHQSDDDDEENIPLDDIFDSGIAQRKRQKRQFERRPKETEEEWFGHNSTGSEEDPAHHHNSLSSSPLASPRVSFDLSRRMSDEIDRGDSTFRQMEADEEPPAEVESDEDDAPAKASGPKVTTAPHAEPSPARKRRMRSFSSGPRDTTNMSELLLERVIENINNDEPPVDLTSSSAKIPPPQTEEKDEGEEMGSEEGIIAGDFEEPPPLRRSTSVPAEVINQAKIASSAQGRAEATPEKPSKHTRRVSFLGDTYLPTATATAPQLYNTTTRRRRKEDSATLPANPSAAAPPQTLRQKLRAIRDLEAEKMQQKRRVSLDEQRENPLNQLGELNYSTTISTGAPLVLELEQLREHFSEFRKERFIAPVEETIQFNLFGPKTQATEGKVQQAFFLLKEPRKKKDFVISGKEHQFTHKRRHIIICGDAMKAFLHLIAPMRSQKLSPYRIRPIVFLHPEEPPTETLKLMSKYPEVYFVQGSTLSDFDLRRAGIKYAKAVVLLTARNKKVEKTKDWDLIDANTVFAFRSISLHYPSVSFMVAEMVEGPNMRFLDVGGLLLERKARAGPLSPGKGSNPDTAVHLADHHSRIVLSGKSESIVDRLQKSMLHYFKMLSIGAEINRVEEYPRYHYRSLFAGGNVWSQSMLDSLFAQVLVHPGILQVVLLLSGGSQSPQYFDKSSHLYQIPIPGRSQGFEDNTFGELFAFLLERGIMALALFRCHEESLYRVFVLALSDPIESLWASYRGAFQETPTRPRSKSFSDTRPV